MFDDWDMGEKSMRVRLDKVLSPGQTCSYEYDYGTTTELKLKVISERQVAARGNAIQVLARNMPPVILCDDCAVEHECGEEMLLPVVNSPRVGMCAYTG